MLHGYGVCFLIIRDMSEMWMSVSDIELCTEKRAVQTVTKNTPFCQRESKRERVTFKLELKSNVY